MKTSVFLYLLIAVATIASCEKDKTEPVAQNSNQDIAYSDSLQTTLILGTWDIESQMIGNIGGGLVFGQSLHFAEDPNPNDFAGLVTHTESGLKKTGTFEISDDSLLIVFNSGQLDALYSIENDALYLTYTSGSDTIYETWRKQ